MTAFRLSPVGSGGFLPGFASVHAEEMSSTAGPTVSSSLLTSDQLTVVAASFSSLVLFVLIVVLLSLVYRKDSQCCKLCPYPETHAEMDAPSQHHSSRQTLVGSPGVEQTQIRIDNIQAAQLFYVGLPSSYSLTTLEAPLPRLPSYESVRKKDRQRQIHMMIAHRFGLNGPIEAEPPPTYEESVRQSMELPYSILSSDVGISIPPPPSGYTNAESDTPHPIRSETHSSVLPE